MSSETSMVAASFRLQEWAAQIRKCQNRPADVSVASWCADHGITKALRPWGQTPMLSFKELEPNVLMTFSIFSYPQHSFKTISFFSDSNSSSKTISR